MTNIGKATQKETPTQRYTQEQTIVRVNWPNNPHIEQWRCLACLTHGIGDNDIITLAIQVHLTECIGNQTLANMRQDLLQAISGVSEEEYAAGWLHDIPKILINRESIWAILADAIGWPIGYLGIDGWDSDAASALARYTKASEE